MAYLVGKVLANICITNTLKIVYTKTPAIMSRRDKLVSKRRLIATVNIIKKHKQMKAIIDFNLLGNTENFFIFLPNYNHMMGILFQCKLL